MNSWFTMILSNKEIVTCIKKQYFDISPLEQSNNLRAAPFNTSAIDLRLGHEILVPKKDGPTQLDLSKPGIAAYLQENSTRHEITDHQPFSLKRDMFVLGNALEVVNFPLRARNISYSARVEGKSSIARCGILVHFTAPTIHAGFEGTITLEIINFGPKEFLLKPNMYICQLIIEEVKGNPATSSNQFRGQRTASGHKSK